MASQQTTQTSETLRVQNSFFDFDQFDDVTVIKDVEFVPATSVQDAAARLDNDGQKLLDAINDGLRSELRRQARATSNGWFVKTDDGSQGEPYAGTGESAVDGKKVSKAITDFAKSIFGKIYTTDKAAAKDKAREMIKSNPVILEGLKSSATVSAEETE